MPFLNINALTGRKTDEMLQQYLSKSVYNTTSGFSACSIIHMAST